MAENSEWQKTFTGGCQHNASKESASMELLDSSLIVHIMKSMIGR
jgi:hypothetical protein